MIVSLFHMLSRREAYRDLGPDYFTRRHSRDHHARRLARQLQALGYKVTLQRTEEAA